MLYIINDFDLGPYKGTLPSGIQWDFETDNDEIYKAYNLIRQKLVLYKKSKIDFHCFEGENNEPFWAIFMLDNEPHDLISVGEIYNENNIKPTKEEISLILGLRFPKKQINVLINPGL